MSGDLTTQIERAFAAEQANPVLARTRGDIPTSYEAITPDWLTDILCSEVPGALVIAHRLGPPDEGTNNRRRIHLTYNEQGAAAGLPPSVFCKGTQGLANRLMLGHSGGIICEVTFWNAARALLDIEAPTARFAAYDPVGFNSIVVLDDLEGRATFCSEETTVDRSFAEQQMALLARLHGRFFEAPELATSLSVLPTWHQRFNNLMRFHLEESCAAGVLASEPFLAPGLFARRADIWPSTLRSLEALRDLPKTLCHGDVHLKNWYVLTDGTVGLGDWGVAHRGHWSRDVAYTIATSLAVEDRRRWERDLLACYLDQLAALGVARVPFDEALLHYRQSLLTALAFWTLTLKPTPDFPDMQPEATARTFIERLGWAVDDLDVLGSV
jgi:thiamine kinase-like enzyme